MVSGLTPGAFPWWRMLWQQEGCIQGDRGSGRGAGPASLSGRPAGILILFVDLQGNHPAT